MRISAKCDYACRALLELSLHWPKAAPLQIQEIAERQNIPQHYLVQILIQLKRQGLVVSSRGKEGGYNLMRAPEAIGLGEVIMEMAGPLLPAADSATKKDSVFSGVWKDVEEAMSRVLDRVTFDDICRKARGEENIILYQI